MKVYRVEDPVLKHGIWRKFDGTYNPVWSKLTFGKCRNMPMEDSDFYRTGGKQWFAATDTPDKLKAWFDAQDIAELKYLGYDIYEFEVDAVKTVSPFEVVFTRDSIKGRRWVNPAEIWSN